MSIEQKVLEYAKSMKPTPLIMKMVVQLDEELTQWASTLSPSDIIKVSLLMLDMRDMRFNFGNVIDLAHEFYWNPKFPREMYFTLMDEILSEAKLNLMRKLIPEAEAEPNVDKKASEAS
jgi:hypothetical protein